MSAEGPDPTPREGRGRPRGGEVAAEDGGALPRELRPGIRLRLIGLLGAALIRAWGATLRVEWLGRENLRSIEEMGGRVCYAVWHGNLPTLAHSHRDRGIVSVVDHHGSGDDRYGNQCCGGDQARANPEVTCASVCRNRLALHGVILPAPARPPARRVQSSQFARLSCIATCVQSPPAAAPCL